MIGARFGATTCNTLPGCAVADGPGGVSLAVFNPLIATASLTIEHGAMEALHLSHRMIAVLLTLVVIRIALFAPGLHGMQRQAAYATALFAVAQIASGAWLALRPALGLALAHNMGAALLLAALAAFAVLIASPRFETRR